MPFLGLSDLDDDELVDTLTALYGWTNPEEAGVASTPPEALAEQIVPRLLRDSGVAAVDGDRLAGVGALADFGTGSLALLSAAAPGRPDTHPLGVALRDIPDAAKRQISARTVVREPDSADS